MQLRTVISRRNRHLQVTRSVHLQNISVSHTVGDPLDYSALTGLDFHQCAADPVSSPDQCREDVDRIQPKPVSDFVRHID